MKTLLALFLLVAVSLPAASPYTLEIAPGTPGMFTNDMKPGLVAGKGISVVLPVINPEAEAAKARWEKQYAEYKNSQAAAVAPMPAADTQPVPQPTVANAPAKLHGFYSDAFLSLTTPDFSHSESYAYGLGVGYAFTPVFSADVRVTHEGFDVSGQAVKDIGGRVIARLPFEFLAPYVFAGAAFDLGPDQWRLRPGVGAEIGMSRLMEGMSLIAEAGLDADLKGNSGYLFTGGIRWRF